MIDIYYKKCKKNCFKVYLLVIQVVLDLNVTLLDENCATKFTHSDILL